MKYLLLLLSILSFNALADFEIVRDESEVVIIHDRFKDVEVQLDCYHESKGIDKYYLTIIENGTYKVLWNTYPTKKDLDFIKSQDVWNTFEKKCKAINKNLK